MSADIISFAGLAFMENQVNGFTVVQNIQPVANVFAVAVNRYVLFAQRIGDNLRNQLFRMLFRTVIVGTVGNRYVHAVSAVIRTDQHIRTGFGRGIRRTRIIGCRFLEKAGFAQRAINFIGRNMMKTAVLITGLKLVRRFHPGIARNIQQHKRTDNIRLNKGFRTGNRIIDMALGGKMNNAADIVFRKQLFNQRPVTDVALNKFIIGTLCTVAQIVRIAGISQLIEVNNLIFRIFLGKIRNKIGSDKAGTAGN